MKIALRADERTAIIAALEAEYGTDREAAETMFRLVTDLLGARESFGIKFHGFAFGPWYHATEVKKLATSLGGDASVHRLWSPGRFMTLQEPPTHRKPTGCHKCGHPLFAHGFSGIRGCVVKKCRCKEVVK